ncbi:1-phosphofructokinase family hexose kinase [Microbispora sp. KK1-11]|uniref:1-phosphofructokinase family hexose kinase n=1 Tax=Microbispora sp. KK1-11 TaxID=2053005 RepID=UPI0021AF154A|nr:1-phosphofructokinase family hexose kinase [Microbispora sp. KK1-11]
MTGVILTVTLNAALDVTYGVDDVDWDGVNRVRGVHRRAGGKGVNVARVLTALGHEVLAAGLAGGPTGDAVLADLAAAGVPTAFTPIAGETRTTLAVRAARRTTLFNEPGPVVTPEELSRFLDAYERALGGAAAVVISGSLPRGLPADLYATLAAVAARHDVPAVVDADGAPLRHAPAGRPAVLKPNAEELARAVRPDAGEAPDIATGARLLRDEGAGSVVVSLGADGVLAATPEGTWRARMPYRVEGNPTGAGDALVAGLALGLVEGTPWPERLRRAAALGAAAVAAPVAGDFDPGVYRRVHPAITVEPHHP